MNTFNSLKNHFLIATPALQDRVFTKALIYICQHDNQGALGVIINKTIAMSYHELLSQIGFNNLHNKQFTQPVLSGGPVDIDCGVVLHNSQNNHWQSTLETSEQIKLTSSKDILEDIANNNFSSDYLIGLGYSGWSAGQLENEIIDNAWLTCPANQKILFKDNIKDKFDNTCKLLGINWVNLSTEIGHA